MIAQALLASTAIVLLSFISDDATTIERCQIRFDNHAALALVASRFVPGTSLPTYVAAGLLSMPVTQFAAVTPFGALVWIGGIFIITKLLGSQALIGFSFLQGKIAAIVFTAFFLTATLFLLKRLVTDGRDGSPSRPLGASHGAARPAVAPDHAVSKAGTCSRSQKWRSPVLIRRWMHWEFWPAWLFYIPLGVY